MHEAIAKAIEDSESRFKTMADSSPVLLWMSRQDGMCTFFNQTWLDFTGRSISEEWGIGWAERVHFEDLQHCLDSYFDAFNKREEFEIEYRLKRYDGEFRWVLHRGVPRFLGEQRFAGFIGSCLDISDRKLVELSMLKSHRDAVDSSRLKSEFLANVSHEIRTPLNGIVGIVDLLQKTSLNIEQKTYLDALQESSDVLLTLVNDLLDFAKLEAGKFGLRTTAFNLYIMAEKVFKFLGPKAEKKGIELRLKMDLRLPKIVIGDHHRLRQVMINLIDNAIKFTEAGAVELRIVPGFDGERSDSQSRSVFRLEVSDTGIGISKADQSRLFLKFGQIDGSLARRHGGTGLGLALCKQLVEMMGGEIGLESEEKVGSTFWVNIPLKVKKKSQRQKMRLLWDSVREGSHGRQAHLGGRR